MVYVDFEEYLPDQADYNNPGLTLANNVLPLGTGYGPVPAFMATSTNALAARSQGMISALSKNNVAYNITGDNANLYYNTSGSWSSITRLSGAYNLAPEDNWAFTKFGERILATNFEDVVQTYTMDVDSKAANLTATTTVLAKYITTVRDFVLVGYTYDTSDGSVPYRVWWSGINDPTQWTVSAVNQCDFQDFPGRGGKVTQVVGGDYGIVFQERAIQRMTYVGSPLIFQFDEIERDRGTIIPGGVIRLGRYTYYISNDGFFVCDGYQSIPIGVNKIDTTFFADLDQSNLHRVSTAVDATKQIIYWSYPGVGNSGGTPNRLLMYNYSPSAKQRWSTADMTVEIIGNNISAGYTLEDLDAFSSNLDTLTPSMDSAFWIGGARSFCGFDTNHNSGVFTGSNLTASIISQESELIPGKKSKITRVRPMIEGSASITLAIGARNAIGDPVSYGPTAAMSQVGDMSVRSQGRYQRVKMTIAGAFTRILGLDLMEWGPGDKR